MRFPSRISIAAFAAVMGVLIAWVVGAVAAGAEDEPRPGPPAIADDLAPEMARQLGVGERVLLVVASTFPTQAEALIHQADFSFGEIQGFYVAPVEQFEGLREALGGIEDDWALVSSFRTEEGALDFFALAVSAGAKPLITPRVQSLPGVYTGLGQEPEPSGAGPLLHAIPSSDPRGA